MNRPAENEFAPFYTKYIANITENNVLPVLARQLQDVETVLNGINPERETYTYALGKWSIRELIGHLIDSERIFGYRAFCISRGEKAPLPAFEENDYVANSDYRNIDLKHLLTEFTYLRKSNLEFLNRLTEKEWVLTGVMSGNPASVRAIAYIIAGHVDHHLGVLKRLYSAG